MIQKYNLHNLRSEHTDASRRTGAWNPLQTFWYALKLYTHIDIYIHTAYNRYTDNNVCNDINYNEYLFVFRYIYSATQ